MPGKKTKSTSSGKSSVGLVKPVKNKTSAAGGLSGFVYSRLKGGAVGALFTSYKSGTSALSKKGVGGRAGGFVSASADILSKKINNSYIVSSSAPAVKRLLSFRLRVYGTFAAAFGIYTMLFYFTENFLVSDAKAVYEMFFGAALFILSLPLLFSDETLSEALCTSSFGRAVKKITGIHADSMKTDGACGRLNYSFILGVLAGLASYAVGPFKIFFAILLAVAVWIVAARPEFGMVIVSFIVPFAQTRTLILILSFTAFFFIIKIIRKKRYASFEALDAAVLGLLLEILFAGALSISHDSYKSSILFGIFILSYFLTVNLMKSRLWLERMTSSLVIGFSLACAVLAASRLGDAVLGGVSYSLSGVFGDCMLGEMLRGEESNAMAQTGVMLFPVAASFFIKPSFGGNKFHIAVASAFILFPVLTGGFSYTAFAAVAVILLLLIYSEKVIYFVFACVLTVLSASFIFPGLFSKIAAYLDGGIGNTANAGFDVWRGVAPMISEFFFGGIGFGNEAWSTVYPEFAKEGAKGASHAFSLYLQMWTGTGIFGILILLAFLFLFASCVFTLMSELGAASKHPALRHCGIKVNTPDSLGEFRLFSSSGHDKSEKLSVANFCTSGKIGTAAPFCGIFGIAALGIFDNVWHDEKVFLVFWLTAALGAAYARTVRGEIKDILSSYEDSSDPACRLETDIS